MILASKIMKICNDKNCGKRCKNQLLLWSFLLLSAFLGARRQNILVQNSLWNRILLYFVSFVAKSRGLFPWNGHSVHSPHFKFESKYVIEIGLYVQSILGKRYYHKTAISINSSHNSTSKVSKIIIWKIQYFGVQALSWARQPKD